MKKLFILASVGFCFLSSYSQPDRWQQKVKYTMDIQMDVSTNRFTGKQKLQYTNNSPDTLTRLYYHLYFNAFQPNSMMDARSRELGQNRIGRGQDWDPRVKDRILNLKPDEIGYHKINVLKVNGVPQPYKVQETILQVDLGRPILPKTTVTIDMEFESQVPLQVRRSGRDNPNVGVRYSMSQWYPKLCEYDADGWHPNPYVAREFYGVWGDFDVKITIDKKYIIGGTGYLQNPNQIGYGYEAPGAKVTQPAGNTLTWHFVAPNVHDFMWAADPEYKHLVRQIPNGPTIHVLYNYRENDARNDAAWNEIADAAVAVLPFIEKKYGPYPYKQYSFIHGGDGGMEYPMGTLLFGPSLGTAFHEWMHTWYQMLMGTNESLYAWMDEGFTEFATHEVSAYYRETVVKKRMANDPAALRRMDSLSRILPLEQHGSYASYYGLAKSGYEEPMTTHADHYNTNYAYGSASYSKGSVFLAQLGYIVGDQVRDKILLNYYWAWRFKHPTVNDFMRIAEKTSGMELDWYKEYWINGTKTIDYGVDSLWEEGGKTKIRLRRIGKIPMPIDLMIEFRDGSKQLAYIPMYLMFGAKPVEDSSVPRTVQEAWKWTHPTYTFEIDKKLTDIKALEIDPTQRMADLERRNNKLEIPWSN